MTKNKVISYELSKQLAEAGQAVLKVVQDNEKV
jgi:hypothetical protein